MRGKGWALCLVEGNPSHCSSCDFSSERPSLISITVPVGLSPGLEALPQPLPAPSGLVYFLVWWTKLGAVMTQYESALALTNLHQLSKPQFSPRKTMPSLGSCGIGWKKRLKSLAESGQLSADGDWSSPWTRPSHLASHPFSVPRSQLEWQFLKEDCLDHLMCEKTPSCYMFDHFAIILNLYDTHVCHLSSHITSLVVWCQDPSLLLPVLYPVPGTS